MKIQIQPDPICNQEIVLFSFDNHALPFQDGLELQLVHFKHSYEVNLNNIVLGLGEEGAPDSRGISFYGTVCRVGDKLFMWYLGRDKDTEWLQRVCLATSRDGILWHRPELGLVTYNGTRKNNLVALGDGNQHIQSCVVFHEPSDPIPNRRFKMVFQKKDDRKKLVVAYSADGRTWKESPSNLAGKHLEMSGGTQIGNTYYINGQGGSHSATKSRRNLVTYISYDFENWSESSCLGFRRLPQSPRPIPFGKNAGEQVHLGAALWNRGNVILGFYGQWHGHPSNDRRFIVLDLGLVVSHDGLHFWEPIPDFPIVSAAEIGRMPPQYNDSVLRTPGVIQGQGFENIGDETFFWYAPWPEHQSDGVRLARWKRDRLGYLKPFYDPDKKRLIQPQAISAVVHTDGKNLRLLFNADRLNENSRLRISILDEKFEPLAGYSGDQCVELKEPGLRSPVVWKTHKTIDPQIEKIRIKIEFTGLRFEDARLFALYLEACQTF